MIKLSDEIRKKLNHPEVIKGMAKFLLKNFGKGDPFFVRDERGAPSFGIYYNFWSLPDRKLAIYSQINLLNNSKFQKLLFGKNKLDSDILINYPPILSGIFNESNFVEIGWDSSPFVLNYETFQDKEKVKQFEEQSSNKGYHTVFNSSIPLFEKGPWQEYLVEMYFNSIGWGDTENKNNLLL